MAEPEFRPNDTIAMRLKESRGARETIGTGSGLGSAAVVLWLADLVGVKIDPITAGVIGGFLTSSISAAIRAKLRS